MASNGVNAIMQDSEGAIWFGTGDGVSWFDGKSWQTYTQKDGLADNGVRTITQDKEGSIWIGTDWGGVSQFDGKSWQTYTKDDGLADNEVSAIIQDKEGAMWVGANDGVSRFDGKSWQTYTQKDGLADNEVRTITQDKEGAIWVGTWGGGLSRYDGKSWQTYNMDDGLASNDVSAILQDKEGAMWVGTHGSVSRFDRKSWKIYREDDGLAGNDIRAIMQDKEGAIWVAMWGGVSRFDGKSWQTYTEDDGLANNAVSAILQDKEGTIWFGTGSGSVSQFDGKSWQTYTEMEIHTEMNGLVDNEVYAIFQDKKGAIWFGTDSGGVSQFDGKGWQTYTEEDGLASNEVYAIIQDEEETMWFGTHDGVSRFDGKSWQTYNMDDGLVDSEVRAIIQDKKGAMWFGTLGSVSRFDGKHWQTYTKKDGLAAGNWVDAILQDNEEVIWVGTDSGGVSRFDGRCFQTIDSRDGLQSDAVRCIYMDRSGQIWLGTSGGVVLFTPNKIPPPVYITQVLADEKTYSHPDKILNLPDGVTRVAFDFHAISFKTRPGEMKYFYQLVGRDADWQGPTNQETVEYFNLEPREYTFQVQAVDRDLNYSKIASVLIFIPSPPFYKATIFPVSLSIIVVMSMFGVIILGIQRLRLSRAEKMRLQKELEDAHQMQLSLLPKSAPLVEGFDIAGSSRPAREVGGDFFDYLSLTDGKSGIALADVSGKGLKSAMNAVLASGMLHVLASGMIHELVKIEVSCGEILSVLNAHLYPRMEKQMFTALGLAIFDPNAKTLRWANAAQPYPIIKRGEQVFEFEGESELPIGMMRNLEYQDRDLELQAGDIVTFYTDGIIEAENETEEMYGTERLEQIIANISSTISAEEIITTILQDVDDFVGTAEQYDDMTVVVVKKL